MRTIQSWVRVAVVVGVAGAMSSCAPGQWPGTAFIPPASGPPGFVACTEPAGSAERDIGPEGGAVVLERTPPTGSSRRHVLTVPTNAVPSGVIRFAVRNIGNGYVGVSATANPNRDFNPPVTLRLSYAGCEGATPARPLQMYRWERVDPATWDWVPIGGDQNRTEQWVEVDRTDLSEYALGTA